MSRVARVTHSPMLCRQKQTASLARAVLDTSDVHAAPIVSTGRSPSTSHTGRGKELPSDRSTGLPKCSEIHRISRRSFALFDRCRPKSNCLLDARDYDHSRRLVSVTPRTLGVYLANISRIFRVQFANAAYMFPRILPERSAYWLRVRVASEQRRKTGEEREKEKSARQRNCRSVSTFSAARLRSPVAH